MNIPCAIAVKECFPCADNTPFANFSAEAPDFDRFFSVFTFEDSPPLGDLFFQIGCRVVCYSAISQADADLCALRAAQQCLWPTWSTPPSPQHPRGQQRIIFSNSEQDCVTSCANNSFTFTVPAGTFFGLTQAQADDNAFQYACKQAQAHRICFSTLDGGACVGEFYDENIAVTGNFLGEAPTNHWSISAGELPPGLTFHGGDLAGSEANIDGIPTTSGVFSFTVTITSPNEDTASKDYTITVANIINGATLPDAPNGVHYSVQLVTSGTTAPVTWAVTTGILPAGLSLGPATGIISGTPTTVGSSTFVITETDSSS
jgi:hypothetical protein